MSRFGLRLFNKPQQQIEAQPISVGKEIAVAGSSYWDDWNLRPYNPAEIYQQRGNYSLYDEMRQDDQIYSVLTLKKIMVLNSDWYIQCEDEDIGEFITMCFTEYLDGLFSRKLFEMLSALDYGFSVTEKIVDYVDTPWGKKLVFTALKTRAPHSFEFHTDDYGNIVKFLQHVNYGSDKILDQRKFILYSYQSEFGNPYGNSEINRGVYRAWVSKNAIIKFWNIYCERHGMPLHVGSMPRSAGESEKATFKKIIRNIQSKTGVTIPDDFKLELLGSDGSGADVYERAINKYDTMIARKLLVPDLIGLSGGNTRGGSYALGKEQFNMFYTTIKYIRQDIERMVNRELIKDLVAWNFGTAYEAKFVFNPIDEERKEKDMALWLDAVKSGKIPITPGHVNWFLEQVNAPQLTDEEINKIEEQKEEMRQQLAGADNKDEKEDDAKPEPAKDQDEEKDSEVEYSRQYAKEYYRSFTQYEKKTNFAKIERETDSIMEKYKPEMDGIFTLIINGLMDDVRRKKIIENKRLDQINKLKLRHITKLQNCMKNIMRDSYSSGVGSIEKRKYSIAQEIGLTDEDVIDWINENSIYISNVESQEVLKRVQGIIIDGIRSGDGVRDIVSMIEKSLAGWDTALSAGLDKTSRIETIVRNLITKSYNEARAIQFEKMPGEIVAYQYSAIMDGRTSPICMALDGKVFKPSELEYYNPPNHHNCRSLIVPIFVDEKFDGYNKENAPPATDKQDGAFLKLKEAPKPKEKNVIQL